MDKKEEILALLKKAKYTIKKNKNELPSNSWFINENEIVSIDRNKGDSRYPYFCDGLNMWARTSGNINIEEGSFNIFPESHEGREPYIAFYFGIKRKNNYFPISITGAGKLPFETNINRYVIFKEKACYYITESALIISSLCARIDSNKNIVFDLSIINKTNKDLDTYLSSYFNMLMCHREHEYIETKWYRTVELKQDIFNIVVKECLDRNTVLKHCATIKKSDNNTKSFMTTSKQSFLGNDSNQLNCANSLIKGFIEKPVNYTEFSDYGVAAELIPLKLKSNDCFNLVYTITIHEKDDIKTKLNDNDIYDKILNFKFKGFDSNVVNDNVFNYFIKNIFRQNEFCARAKNYAGPMIGFRDIFQQLESSLIWIPEYSKSKIIEAMNYIFDNGRTPRQYAYSKNDKTPPQMDIREFIDQGLWIISTIYTYISYTGDYDILNVICGYYHIEDNQISFSNKKDTILEHLILITNYLISNIDKNTNCLKALYGDWNDALDGLGKTNDASKEYGNGVSMMATFQLYKNLAEMIEILSKYDTTYQKIIGRYSEVRDQLCKGIFKYGIVSNGKEKKILHGWNDNRKQLICGFKDFDGKTRDSLTANAFFILSDAIKEDMSLKDIILDAFDRLDSKYGLKTFNVGFDELDNDIVGRISRLPIGSAENAAVYIHGALFAVLSLFKINESKRAWDQLIKLLPITHNFISTSPFVMPNSYIENKNKNYDGESMSDWFTGSGCVLIKILIRGIFGINVDLDYLKIDFPTYTPFTNAMIDLKIKKGDIHIEYIKTNSEREYFINDIKVDEIKLSNAAINNKKINIKIIGK